MKINSLIVAGLLLTCPPAGATVIAEVGSGGSGFLRLSNASFVAVSFTVGDIYTDVILQAFLSEAASGGGGTAYLTTQLGPGTTIAQQIATGTFSDLDDSGHLVTVLSGITLNPGTYYLVLVGGSAIGGATWTSALTPYSITTAPGASVVENHFYAPSVGAFPPDAGYVAGNPLLVFSVSTSPVPEPATAGLVALGALAILRTRARRRQPERRLL